MNSCVSKYQKKKLCKHMYVAEYMMVSKLLCVCLVIHRTVAIGGLAWPYKILNSNFYLGSSLDKIGWSFKYESWYCHILKKERVSFKINYAICMVQLWFLTKLFIETARKPITLASVMLVAKRNWSMYVVKNVWVNYKIKTKN